MGSITYDFLADSFLFNQSLIENQYASIPEQEIRKKLNEYRNFILENTISLENEVLSNSSNLKLFSGITKPLLPLLTQTAFYLDQIIIADPLFPLTHEVGGIPQTMSEFWGFEKNDTLNRQQIIKAVQYLKTLTPMVEADFVKIMPTTIFSETPKKIPFRYSENGFSDVLPEPLLKFYRERAVVESVKKTAAGMIIDGSFELGRSIHVRFKDHEFEDAKGYLLYEQLINSVDEQTLAVDSTVYLPNELPTQEKFDAWVSQSINQTAEHSYRRLLIENELASQYNAGYLCHTPFAFDLLKQFFSSEDNIKNHTTNSLLALKLPFMEKVDINTLMKVRLEDGEAFQNLRLELDKQFKTLRLINDPEELKVKTENILHEIFEVQLTQVNQKMRQIKRQLGANIALAAGGLFGSVQTGGLSLIALAIAIAQGYKSYNEYLSQKQQNPAFFLWQVYGGK